MSDLPGFDPEHNRRQEEATILMLRVGLALVDDARRDGGFETDQAKLTERVATVLGELGAGGPSGGEPAVTAAPEGHDRVRLSAATDEHSSEGALLRADGVLLEEYSSVGYVYATADEADLTPEQMDEFRRAQEEAEAALKSRFRGERFLRVLVPDRQPDSPVQVLAVELFADGLVVDFTHDVTPESEAAEWDEEILDPFDRWPGIRVEDDVGTKYHPGDGSGSGAQVIHGSFAFTPAVPAAATLLRIHSHDGLVELRL